MTYYQIPLQLVLQYAAGTVIGINARRYDHTYRIRSSAFYITMRCEVFGPLGYRPVGLNAGSELQFLPGYETLRSYRY